MEAAVHVCELRVVRNAPLLERVEKPHRLTGHLAGARTARHPLRRRPAKDVDLRHVCGKGQRPILVAQQDDALGLHALCERAEPLFALRGVALRFSASHESHVIAFNAPMLERALLNLLSNALKFTPEGGTVSVRVKCGERHVQLTVADTGRGIEPERLAHIFERYLDTDRLDPAPPHGLGVGLSLCRRIAQGHGGMLVAESAVGKGTAFTLSLPNARSTDLSLSDRRFDYAGGFDHVLMELSDALPSRAFLQKYLD